MHTHSARGMVTEAELFFRAPGPVWADGPGRETASAGRANVLQHGLDAAGAVGAFVSADPCDGALRRKITVAKLTIRAKFQHDLWPARSLLELWTGHTDPPVQSLGTLCIARKQPEVVARGRPTPPD